MTTTTTPTTFDNFDAFRAWLIDHHDIGLDFDRDSIDMALMEWAFDYATDPWDNPERKFLPARFVERLETIDCAACAAPAGLIYNHEIAAKVPAWWHAIDEQLDDYLDQTGEQPKPRDGAITVGWLVWFAAEWRSYALAGTARAIFDVEA